MSHKESFISHHDIYFESYIKEKNKEEKVDDQDNVNTKLK